MRKMVSELPWIALFTCILALVQLQFKYCVPCMVNALKVVETAIVVVLFRMWVNRDEMQGMVMQGNITDYIHSFAQVFKNHTEL